ncbi:MAG: hypothetical protein HeimC2_32930 [Candidatus Heimdallarchaeota archaeon LC_2]|nr:MAG: hypothetical protein HeimC2_32930 [Candidatus Heimdallarchaeota archaeon LC_2]
MYEDQYLEDCAGLNSNFTRSEKALFIVLVLMALTGFFLAVTSILFAIL